MESSIEEPEIDAVQLLPVTILTGFLGSGKTTLLKYLLDHYDDEKIAIVENEFGDVSIDSQLLKGAQSLELIELNNGCICCSVRGDLTDALHKLIGKIDRGEIAIDRLILETTGLADPAPIIQTFFVDDLIRERVRLDGVIALADAEHIHRQLDEHRVVASQLGFADRIILTKIDRIDDEARDAIYQRIQKINTKTPLLAAAYGEIPKEEWLNINAFDLDADLSINQGITLFRRVNNPQFVLMEQSATPTHKHSFSDAIESKTFKGGELDLDRIGEWMEAVVETHGNDLLRYKGVLAIEGHDQKLIVQGVHKVVGFDFGDYWASDEERQSLIVLIGREIPFDSLHTTFLETEV